MISPPQFNSLEEMDESLWLQNVKLHMHKGIWPLECSRCKQTEEVDNSSIRLNAIVFDKIQSKADYLVVGGVLDNICNSGCMTCNEDHSTKIGSLKSRVYPIIDNTNRFWQLPLERMVHLDINGGEPSASKNYRNILKNLPSNVLSVRINTNCSIIIDEIDDLIARGVQVTVTVSLDGIEETHDQVRWPIKWDRFYKNLMIYKNNDKINLNTWTTISALNIHDFVNIKQFIANNQFAHSYAFLHNPDPLNVQYQNNLTLPYKDMFPGLVAIDKNNQEDLDAFMFTQKQLRELI
jgi:sulfatase maturation enzyme AslB (radical SAM superfamily)